ncbi:CIC11C00000005295 [Sungouiella intermedia]|uniref:CIC11C00000005295 n=1 Tax=Sungouiella intermedia TaxID=45354 RepID=A0A1L0C4W6_9ASCO|nr:CIC11C00000005295 [[Candida] intermedia]
MTSQQQDLVFFSDNSIVSDHSLVSRNSSLHIISHLEGTNPSWLVSSILENCLVGTANLVNRELNRKIINRSQVTFASFIHSKAFWVPLSRKQGVDLDSNPNFQFVDCFSDLFTKQIPNPANAKPQVSKVFGTICKAIENQKSEKKVVVVECPELLLAATDLSSNDLVQHLRKVASLCNTLFVVINTESPLTNSTGALPDDPVFRISDFYVKLYHMSSLNISVQPLSTGRAKDITGCLTVARGSQPANPVTRVVEKEYMFHIAKESVKLYYR